MTLNGLNGNFTLNFHLLRTAFQQLDYIFTVESVYTRDQQRCAEADRDPQNIWNLRKKLRIFRRLYVVGTLTNKTNISI